MSLLTSTVRFGLAPCGCLHESYRRHRVIRAWRCETHSNSYVLVEVLLPWMLRCDSCRKHWAKYRATFSDGVAFVLCEHCETPRPI